MPESGWPFKAISCGKMRRYIDWQNVLDIFRTLAGIWQSFWIIKRFNPDVVFCKGGYVAFPVAVGAWLNRRPVILHESDLVPGLANKLSAKFAQIICVSFTESKRFFNGKRVEMTGNPVRQEMLSGSSIAARKMTALEGHKPVMLVMGGSQGAQRINDFIVENLEKLLEQFQIIHLTGVGKSSGKQIKGYFAQEYAKNELKDFYALTDIMVCRAGANSLAEIEALGKPAILIPLEIGSRGDQVANAAAFVKENKAVIVNEGGLNWQSFSEAILRLENMPASEVKKTAAAKKIAELIKSLCQK